MNLKCHTDSGSGQCGSIGWNIILCTKGWWGPFPGRAHAWVVAQSPVGGSQEAGDQ